MALPWVARVVNGIAPTSTGTKDFLAFGMESCVGAVVEVTWAIADDTLRGGYSKSIGFLDGTNQRNAWSYARDAVTTMVTDSGGSSTKVVHLLDPASGAVALSATFDSFQQSGLFGGIRLNFTTVGGAGDLYRIKVWLFGGSNAECLAWRQAGTSTPTTVTTGFAVDFNVTEHQASNDDAFVRQQRSSFGMSRVDTQLLPDDGTMSLAQLYSGDNVSTSETRRGKANDRLSQLIIINPDPTPDVFQAWSRIENYTSTGFDVAGEDTGGPADGPTLIGLAVKCNDGSGSVRTHLDVGRLTPPSPPSPESITAAGFKPGFAAVAFSARPTENSFTAGAGGGRGATHFAEAVSVCGHDEDNVATTNAGSFADSRFCSLFAHGGTELVATDGQTQLSNGIQISWETLPGVQRRYGLLLIEEAPHEATFGVTMDGPTAAFAAELVFEADFGVTLDGPTPDFAVELVFESSFGVTLDGPVPAFAVLLEFRATFGVALVGPTPVFVAALEFRADFGVVLDGPTPIFVSALEYRASFGVVMLGPTPTLAALLEFRTTFGTALLAPTPAFTALHVPQEFTATFGVQLLAPTPAFTASIPVVAPRTELPGSYDLRTALAGDYGLRADHAGDYYLRTALAGDAENRTVLAGDGSTRTPLAGDFED